ncbi:hypothetical protein CA267_004910 [Alteromonas pelagimontana]|uniref:Uncharacterized protein n=1 Tax=Alteromonas pelagimontana TaxID=1858656 RepID=A0A6M4MAG5_9ALTE|nr:hypothetical protein [Alteromonas pelagimontana]QJR80162.1 hypothetical protein CA267_004910 [Alteromonas pelagimontana]
MLSKPLFALSVFTLYGCNSDDISLPLAPDTVNVTADFESTDNGWIPGFSDFPAGEDNDHYEMQSDLEALPTDEKKHGLNLSAYNRSDDLFMYIKKEIKGLEPSTRYTATIELDLVSNAALGCFGVGGAPGEAVTVKFGFGEEEPKQSDYYMNIDIGSQSNAGANTVVLGNVGIEGLDCLGEEFGAKTLKSTTENTLDFTTNVDGTIWLLIGTDSGYEGYTSVYYDDVHIVLSR